MMLPRRLTTKSHAHRGEREGPLLDVEGRKYHIKDSLEPGINIILDERKREHKKTDEQKEVEEDNDVEHVDSFSDIKIESNKYSRKNVAESENNTRYIETDFGKETKTLSQFLNQQKTNNLKMILPGGHEFQLLNEEGKHHSSRTMDKEDSNDKHEEGNETKKNKKEKLKTLDSFESFDKPDDDENEKAVKENKEDGENKIRGEDENAERKESKEKESETGKRQKDSKKEEKENDGKEKEEAPVIKEDKDDKEYRQQTSSDNDGDERESQTHYPSQSKPDDSRESFYEKNNGKYSGRKKISEKGSDMDTENFESEGKKHHRNDKNDMATNGKDSSKEKDIDKVKESGSTFHMGDAPGIIDHSQFLPHNVAQAEAPPIVDHSKFMAGDEGLAPEVEDHSNFITKNDRGTSAHKGTSRETDETPLSHKGTKQTERNHLNISRNHDAEQQYDTPHVDTYREGDELKSYKSDDHETADQKNMFSTWHHTESTHQSDRCGMTPCEMKNETHDVGHCSELQVGESNVCQPLTHLPTEYQEEPVPPASHVSCQELHCVGMSHPEEPMPSEKSAPHIKHKPDIIKVEFVPEEVTVVGNKTKASSPSGKIRVQFVPGEEIVEPKVSSEEVFARSSNDLTKDKINNDLEVGKHVKSVPSKKEENTFPDEPSNNEKSSPKFNEQPLHGNSKPPEDKPSAKSDSQEEVGVTNIFLFVQTNHYLELLF